MQFSLALSEGESAVRIIFSLSPTPSQAENRSLGTKFETQAPGLEEEKR